MTSLLYETPSCIKGDEHRRCSKYRRCSKLMNLQVPSLCSDKLAVAASVSAIKKGMRGSVFGLVRVREGAGCLEISLYPHKRVVGQSWNQLGCTTWCKRS